MGDSPVDVISKSMQQMDIRKRSSVGGQRRSSFDRFIPNRRGSDFEAAYHRLTSLDTSQNDTVTSVSSNEGTPWRPPTGKRNSGTPGNMQDDRILVFSPRSSLNCRSDAIQDVNDCTTPRGYSPRRYLPKSPERILDMPDIRDDFYCNILDWSCTNNIAVAIDDKVYSWNVNNAACQTIPVGDDDNLPPVQVKSLAWDHMGKRLAIGTVEGDIRVWSKDNNMLYQYNITQELEGKPAGHTNGVVWDRTGNTLYGMHNSGYLSIIDLKHNQVTAQQLQFHHQGAAGLKLCDDNKHLAIGGNDGSIHILNIHEQKVMCIEAHSTATKALAWVPWKNHVLLSGGGTGDGAIKMWNTKTGELLDDIQTDSQVCSMVISGVHRELVTGHGIAHNDIIIWQLPSMKMIGRVPYHKARVLHLALNPKEDMLASLSADESLMMWKCFEGTTRPTHRRSSCHNNTVSPLSFSLR